MKIGDLVEIYRHVPRYESGEIPVGKIGLGVIVDIDHRHHPPDSPMVSWVTTKGDVESSWLGGTTGVVVTMRVVDDSSE